MPRRTQPAPASRRRCPRTGTPLQPGRQFRCALDQPATGLGATAQRRHLERRRRESDRARRARAASAPRPAPVVRIVTIPAGTALPLELTTAVSTETASVEMPVSARLRRAVTVDGDDRAAGGRNRQRRGHRGRSPRSREGPRASGLRFTSVDIDGRREDLRTNPVTFEGEQTKGEDATKIGAGAGIGAVDRRHPRRRRRRGEGRGHRRRGRHRRGARDARHATSSCSRARTSTPRWRARSTSSFAEPVSVGGAP